MSFQPYYSTPDTLFLFYAFLGFLAMETIIAIALVIGRVVGEKLTRATVIGSLITGVIVGLGGAAIYSSYEAGNVNTTILQQNITKKYDVETVTFDFTTLKGGGHGWTPTQSEPQQVMVKVNGVTHVAILTQNTKTAEPTLIDVDTKKDIALRNTSAE